MHLSKKEDHVHIENQLVDGVDISRLAEESLTLRCKATLRLAVVTFVWGLSEWLAIRQYYWDTVNTNPTI